MTRQTRQQRQIMTGTIQEPGRRPQTARFIMDEIKGEDNVVTVTADYTIEGKSTVIADASGTALTVTLPPAIDSTDRRVYIKKIDSSANTVIVDGNGSDNVEGAAASTITAQNGHRMLICDGEQWWRFD